MQPLPDRATFPTPQQSFVDISSIQLAHATQSFLDISTARVPHAHTVSAAYQQH